MSNMKIVSLVANEQRKATTQIELEWYQAIREFRGKLEQLQARLEQLEAGVPPQTSA